MGCRGARSGLAEDDGGGEHRGVLVGNAASMIVLTRAAGSNLNTRAAFLEVVNDALGSLGRAWTSRASRSRSSIG